MYIRAVSKFSNDEYFMNFSLAVSYELSSIYSRAFSNISCHLGHGKRLEKIMLGQGVINKAKRYKRRGREREREKEEKLNRAKKRCLKRELWDEPSNYKELWVPRKVACKTNRARDAKTQRERGRDASRKRRDKERDKERERQHPPFGHGCARWPFDPPATTNHPFLTLPSLSPSLSRALPPSSARHPLPFDCSLPLGTM